VDEAHERSLNIDFVLGLLKRVLAERSDFRVIVSSATMNAEAFSYYFDGAPIVTIDTIVYPVTVIYDPPGIPASANSATASEALLAKISATVGRVLDNKTEGAILCFLPGEKSIKDCMQYLAAQPYGRRLWMQPLYGRLSKEEQERVFDPPPAGKQKIVISTNIAETSVTIADVTAVIDSGLAKLNYYSNRTYTSSLIESPVSKASCNQRRGRAGRTGPGTCYRLYPRKEFEGRPLYTVEEIYRTDLSEVVLRMAELNITDFEQFDFISSPGREGIQSAVETLRLLRALKDDNTLSETGKLMVEFPLAPRHSRIIVEAILRYPEVLEEALIATAFLSAHSPFVLPPGQEMDARKAHHAFRDMLGDFVSYTKLFRTFTAVQNKERFCERSFLDLRVMAEIVNIKEQLEQIVSDLGIPVSAGGSVEDYLCCVAAGMLQFVCLREGRENYRSLTAERIQIHPGSSMFKANPLYMVAGEIVRTSRMFAMSVSPLTRSLLERIEPGLEARLGAAGRRKQSGMSSQPGRQGEVSSGTDPGVRREGRKRGKAAEDSVSFGGEVFAMEKLKGKNYLTLPLENLLRGLKAEPSEGARARIAGFRGKVVADGQVLLNGEKAALIIALAESLPLWPIAEDAWKRKLNIQPAQSEQKQEDLVAALEWVLRVAPAKLGGSEAGFICLYNDGRGSYWFKVSRGFSTALNESLSSLESLIDELAGSLTEAQKAKANGVYRKLQGLYE
jgi:HrpA-like RNA helicase